MSKDKNREPVKKNLDSAKRFRAGILFSVTILFSIILFPNLIVTKHQYNLGDVAERDIKSPRDFFIEDKALTEANRQHAQEAVLTVYDYDAGLAASLTSKVDEIFTEMRAAAATASEDPLKQPAANDATGQVVAAAGNPAQNVITDKRKYLEEKLGIRVSTGAFMVLEKAGFSEEI